MNASFENYRNLSPKHRRILFYAFIGVFIFAIGSIAIAFTENKLILENGQLEITGLYGEKIPVSDIQLIELTNKKPSLQKRLHGFSVGNHKKGFFRTNSGEKVKAIINSSDRPWILITKKSGEKIYFSSKKPSNKISYEALKKSLPNESYNALPSE